MIYFEFDQCGAVRVYDMTDRLLILRSAIEARARALPEPKNIKEAWNYYHTMLYAFHAFDDFEQAECWIGEYQGFRSGEARAEFRRFLNRKFYPLTATA